MISDIDSTVAENNESIGVEVERVVEPEKNNHTEGLKLAIVVICGSAMLTIVIIYCVNLMEFNNNLNKIFKDNT